MMISSIASFATTLALLGFMGGACAAEGHAPPPPGGLKVATFAAGCFWCVEPPFDKLQGVVSTTSGYTDGRTKNPTYQQVSAGETGHTEAVQVIYDPARVTYATLLETFWRNVDPFDAAGQFCDRGDQYRPGIYTHDEEQARLAAELKQALGGRFSQSIRVEIKPASPFYAAEAYHQDYYKKNPVRYSYYRFACGRDARLKVIWGEPRS